MVELEIGYALLILGLLVCLADWRAGAYLVPLAGVAQDPIRKLHPEEPVSLVLLGGLFFAAAVGGFVLQRGGLGLGPLFARFRALRVPMQLFLLLFGAHIGATLLRYQNVRIIGIGLISYLVPVLAVVFGYQFASRQEGAARTVRRYLVWYAALVAAGISGIFLDYAGYDSPLLRQVGGGIMIYDLGTVLKPYCGFFRSPEIAGWHAGAAICVLIALAFSSSGVARRALLLSGVPLLLAAAALTGRRKVIMLVVIFASMQAFLVLRASRRSRALLAALLLGGVAAGLLAGDFFDLRSPDERMGLYMQRVGTVFGDAQERFELLGLGSILWAVQRHGMLGAGAGVLSQGAQYFGGGAEAFGGSGEGGLGKITAELGVPGLLVFAWVLLAAGREAWGIVERSADLPSEERLLLYGLIALLAANLPGFIVASQAYGDPFIVITMGLLGGFAAALGGESEIPLSPPLAKGDTGGFSEWTKSG